MHSFSLLMLVLTSCVAVNGWGWTWSRPDQNLAEKLKRSMKDVIASMTDPIDKKKYEKFYVVMWVGHNANERGIIMVTEGSAAWYGHAVDIKKRDRYFGVYYVVPGIPPTGIKPPCPVTKADMNNGVGTHNGMEAAELKVAPVLGQLNSDVVTVHEFTFTKRVSWSLYAKYHVSYPTITTAVVVTRNLPLVPVLGYGIGGIASQYKNRSVIIGNGIQIPVY